MNIYTPDYWVILEFSTPSETAYKVFAGWRGDYLGGEQWQLSSGITGADLEDETFTCHNVSGSKYVCKTSNYGMKLSMMTSMFRGWQRLLSDQPDTHIRQLTQDEFTNGVLNKTTVFLR